MEKSFPFNAVITDGVPDRVYSAEDFAAERAAFVSNGVTAEGALLVLPSVSGGLSADVQAGCAVINGYTYFNTAPLTLTAEAAHATLARLDLVVLRLDLDAREIRCYMKTGTPGEVPVLPQVTSTERVTELPLAQLRISAAKQVLEAEDIADLRVRADYILNRVDVEALLARYEEALRTHFNTEDAAELVRSAKTVKTDAGEGTVLCGDGVYRPANLDGGRYEELVRFTADGEFSPAQYPTRDGRYDIVIQGGGGSGAVGAVNMRCYGGEAGGFLSLSGVPLNTGRSYAVKVGAGGAAPRALSGENAAGLPGGASAFDCCSVPGGRGGVYGSSLTSFGTPVSVCGCTLEMGSVGMMGKGGSSLLGSGGTNVTSGNGKDGTLGSGGGAGSPGNGTVPAYGGRGGNGVVIVYGLRPL